MLKSVCSSLVLATLVLSGWGSTAAQAQNPCGTTTNVTHSTMASCVVPAQPQAISCDAIPGAASHQMNIREMAAVEVAVQASGGSPTLVVVGPDGCFSALAHNGRAAIPGFWSPGLYNIYVGGITSNVTLTITHTN